MRRILGHNEYIGSQIELLVFERFSDQIRIKFDTGLS